MQTVKRKRSVNILKEKPRIIFHSALKKEQLQVHPKLAEYLTSSPTLTPVFCSHSSTRCIHNIPVFYLSSKHPLHIPSIPTFPDPTLVTTHKASDTHPNDHYPAQHTGLASPLGCMSQQQHKAAENNSHTNYSTHSILNLHHGRYTDHSKLISKYDLNSTQNNDLLNFCSCSRFDAVEPSTATSSRNFMSIPWL